ncbi:MAG: YfiM family protein, partial [Ignavibacteria bacterium]|nr:YfiM family protein [Ignavibacteria bacterium]
MKQFLVVLMLLSVPRAYAQDSVTVTDGFRFKPEFTGRKVIATSAIGGLLVTSLIWSYDTWWRDAGRPFHFQSENWLNGPFLGLDKVGHFYTSYFYFHTFRNIMLWGGYEPSKSDLWATIASAFFAVAIEVGDG